MFIENSTLYYYYDYYDWTEYYNSEDEYYVTVAPINDVGAGPNVTSNPFTFPPLPSKCRLLISIPTSLYITNYLNPCIAQLFLVSPVALIT